MVTDKPDPVEGETLSGWTTVEMSRADYRLRERPIMEQQRPLWMAIRQALLMVVDAIEVYLQLEIRTAELRRRIKHE